MSYVTPPMALEELKVLQAVISKHDDLRSQLLGWCVALITGLSVAHLSKPLQVDSVGFLSLSLAIVLLFLWVGITYKVAQDRAIERVRQIEVQIRTQSPYDGPLISESLSRPNLFSDQCSALKNVRVWGPFVALAVIVVLVTLVRG